MEPVPDPALEAPETWPRYVLRMARRHWRLVLGSAVAQALGYYCRSLPEGVWQSICSLGTTVIEAFSSGGM